MAGRPLVAYAFDAVLEAGAHALVVVVGDRGEQVREAFGGDYRGTSVRYVSRPEPLGLEDAVRRGGDAVDGTALVLNGDTVVRGPLGDVAAAGRDADAAVLVDRVSRDAARDTGVLDVETG